MSNNELIIIKGNDLDTKKIEWTEWQCFTMSAHYMCPKCGQRLLKIDVPYKGEHSRVRYKPLYRCMDCNLYFKWERKNNG